MKCIETLEENERKEGHKVKLIHKRALFVHLNISDPV